MIGERIKKIRLFRKMTQEELVEGISSIAYLSRIENEQINPSGQFLHKVAETLDIQIELLTNQLSAEMIEERVKQVFHDFWLKDEMDEESILFLHLYSTEMQSNKVMLMIFSMLIFYYNANSRLKEAKEVYHYSLDLINFEDDSVSNEVYYYYLLSCGNLHYDLFEFVKANKYFINAKAFLPENNNKEKGRFYYYLSLVHQRISDDDSLALYFANKSYNLLKNAGNNHLLVKVVLFRSFLYNHINEVNKALECSTEGQKILDSDPGLLLRPSVVYTIGEVCQENKDFQSSIKYFNDYVSMAKNRYPERIVRGYKKLIDIYIELKQWEMAAKYLELARTEASYYKDVFFDKELKLQEIEIFKIKNMHDKYEKEMQKLIEFCSEENDILTGKYLANELADHYFNNQSYKKSARYFKLAFDFDKRLKNKSDSLGKRYF